mmetsp:Transcript_44113/g.122140  ORF Transcript_44113/g.122140 Transcript_44113/m.122140 type:complete len:222 (+) Transcript_44113:527-1192(+)
MRAWQSHRTPRGRVTDVQGVQGWIEQHARAHSTDAVSEDAEHAQRPKVPPSGSPRDGQGLGVGAVARCEHCARELQGLEAVIQVRRPRALPILATHDEPPSRGKRLQERRVRRHPRLTADPATTVHKEEDRHTSLPTTSRRWVLQPHVDERGRLPSKAFHPRARHPLEAAIAIRVQPASEGAPRPWRKAPGHAPQLRSEHGAHRRGSIPAFQDGSQERESC